MKLSEKMQRVADVWDRDSVDLAPSANLIRSFVKDVAQLEDKLEGRKEAMRINTDFKLMAMGLQDKLERQAEHITHTNDSIADRNREVRKWKRLHHELGKRYALLKTVSEDIPDTPGEA